MKDILVKLLGIDRKLRWNGYARFPKKTVLDSDVSKFAFEHMKFVDRFDFRKVTSAVLSSFAILSEDDFNETEYKKFKFDF